MRHVGTQSFIESMSRWTLKAAATLTIILAASSLAETHEVRVANHRFVPKNLTVKIGDTVLWNWQTDFHNVVSYTDVSSGENGAFKSDLLNTGDSFQIEITRELANTYAKSTGKLFYVCEPHIGMDMVGYLNIERTSQDFTATPSNWQNTDSITAAPSETSTSLTLTLSDDETNIFLDPAKNSSFQEGQSLSIKRGTIGNTGQEICQISATGSQNGCNFTAELADDLFRAGFYIEIDGKRGQLTKNSTETYEVSGRISGQSETVELELYPYGKKAVHSITGSYSFSGVTNGVYLVKPSDESISLSSYPVVVVNNDSVVNVDLTIGNTDIPAKPTPVASVTPTVAVTPVASPTPVVAVNLPTATPTASSSDSTPTPESAQTPIDAEEKPAEKRNCSVALKEVPGKAETFNPAVEMELTAVNKLYIVVNGTTIELDALSSSLTLSLQSGDNTIELLGVSSSGATCSSGEKTISVNSALNQSSVKKLNKIFNKLVKSSNKKLLRKARKLVNKMSKGGVENPDFPQLSQTKIKQISKRIGRSWKCVKRGQKCDRQLKRLARTLRKLTVRSRR